MGIWIGEPEDHPIPERLRICRPKNRKANVSPLPLIALVDALLESFIVA